MHDEQPSERTDGPSRERDVDADEVVEDAIEFFSTDEDEPAALPDDTDGPPPPNA